MPNVNAVLNEQIRRLARREIKSNTTSIKRATAHYRRDIAALKRQVAQLLRQLGSLQKRLPNQIPTPSAYLVQKSRLRIDGLKAHRAKLGISAKEYGKLIGVSQLTIYNWESGRSKPRRSQLPRIVAVRGIGKREALQRLGAAPESSNGQSEAPVRVSRSRARGTFAQTAEEFILSLLKGRKVLKTADINAAWKKSGRARNADNTLSLLTKKRKIVRTHVKGSRGSEYRA